MHCWDVGGPHIGRKHEWRGAHGGMHHWESVRPGSAMTPGLGSSAPGFGVQPLVAGAAVIVTEPASQWRPPGTGPSTLANNAADVPDLATKTRGTVPILQQWYSHRFAVLPH